MYRIIELVLVFTALSAAVGYTVFRIWRGWSAASAPCDDESPSCSDCPGRDGSCGCG